MEGDKTQLDEDVPAEGAVLPAEGAVWVEDEHTAANTVSTAAEGIDFDSITLEQLVNALYGLAPEQFAKLAEFYGLGSNQSANPDNVAEIISRAYETVFGTSAGMAIADDINNAARRIGANISGFTELAALYGVTPWQFAQAEVEAERMFQNLKVNTDTDMRDHFRIVHLPGIKQVLRAYQRFITPTNIASATVMASYHILLGIQNQMPALIQEGVKGAAIAAITIGASMTASRYYMRRIDSY